MCEIEPGIQPDAEPVAWRYLVRGIWSVTNIKGAAEFWQSEGCVVEPLYTALAQSDASAGLIEAAAIAENIANGDEVEPWVKRSVLHAFAKFLRARAADRSGK